MGKAMGFGELTKLPPEGVGTAFRFGPRTEENEPAPYTIIVESIYSLKRILLLGGLNQAPAIWLESGSDFIRFLSSRPGKTMTARRGFFCCCN